MEKNAAPLPLLTQDAWRAMRARHGKTRAAPGVYEALNAYLYEVNARLDTIALAYAEQQKRTRLNTECARVAAEVCDDVPPGYYC